MNMYVDNPVMRAEGRVTAVASTNCTQSSLLRVDTYLGGRLAHHLQYKCSTLKVTVETSRPKPSRISAERKIKSEKFPVFVEL